MRAGTTAPAEPAGLLERQLPIEYAKRLCLAAGAAAGGCRSTGLATTPANTDDPAEVTPAWVAWSGPRPYPAGPPPGTTVGAPCGSGVAMPASLVGWSESSNQAKGGGDAWWAAGRRAGPGRSASSPDRGSTRATDAPAGRSPTIRVGAPRRPAIGAAGRAASTAGRSTATATLQYLEHGSGPLVVELDRLWWVRGTGKRRTAQAGVWPWRWLAGAAAGAARLAPRGGGSTALGKQAPRRWRRVIPTRSGR
jgi:hypothetical protein